VAWSSTAGFHQRIEVKHVVGPHQVEAGATPALSDRMNSGGLAGHLKPPDHHRPFFGVTPPLQKQRGHAQTFLQVLFQQVAHLGKWGKN